MREWQDELENYGRVVFEEISMNSDKQKVKLTPAQLKLLQEEKGYFVADYKPGLKLIEHALIDSEAATYGRLKWEINEAGRAYLAATSQ